MKLSVIVPVYRVEPYLDYCLRSIVQQDIEDCEVILMDDKSPDHSGEICDAWTQKDARFRVVHCPENKGLSAARNQGIELARGEYITFIDSDDYLSPHTLSPQLELLDIHPEVDVLEYPVCVHHGAEQTHLYLPGHGEITDYAGWLRRKGYRHCYACNKIYKRHLWEDIRFPEGRLFEDLLTIPSVMRQARRILASDKGLYYYCSRKGSISNNICHQNINELLQANLQLYNTLLQEKELTEKELDEMYLRLCDPQILALQLGGVMRIPERKIPILRALTTPRPGKYRIKAILKSVSGRHYCGMVASLRKALRL